MAGGFSLALVEIDNASRKGAQHAAEKLLWHRELRWSSQAAQHLSDMPA
jgi:hypothetical protein